MTPLPALLLLALLASMPGSQPSQLRTVYAWVSGEASVQAAATAQLRNRTFAFIDGVRGFCGVGWHRTGPSAPWTIGVTSPVELANCKGVRTALAETNREFEVVLVRDSTRFPHYFQPHSTAFEGWLGLFDRAGGSLRIPPRWTWALPLRGSTFVLKMMDFCT